MPRELRLNHFDMNCVGHIQHGMWTHPRDRSTEYTDLDYWLTLARTLEAGLFDGIFLADVLGIYDIYGGGPEAAIRHAVQVPVNDPMLLIPAMASVTRHLGFGVTSNTTYEPPYAFARRMSTLDHLTRGRVGWNIVTGYLDSAARAAGMTTQIAHDERYDRADEYLGLLYRLWEGSWEEGAVLRDRGRGVFADPERIHTVDHDGAWTLHAPHLCEPSPQRTPVLYQAGTSERGRRFAATHAECVFVNATTRANVRTLVADLRSRAAASGRGPRALTVFAGATIVTGRTDAEAQDRFEEYRRHSSVEGALAHFSAATGIDFARYAPDEPIRAQRTEANQSNLEAVTTRSADVWTKGRLADSMVLGSRQAPIVGEGGRVAEEMIAWAEECDIDGFNLSRTVMPECVDDFVRLVVPELQSRGAYKRAYALGTLRQKLSGGDGLLPARHPAARCRLGKADEHGLEP